MAIPLDAARIKEAAQMALAEDCGTLDVTTHIFTPVEAQAQARIFTKESCVLAGLPVAERVFLTQDAALQIELSAADGQTLAPGQTVLRLQGALSSILTGERVALNFLQHLSGIATQTARFVAAVHDTKTQILDTRKTTPGLRHLEKYAVRCGGGTNHRFGLHDQFLVKDNHLVHYGKTPDRATLATAIQQARAFRPAAPLECEADTLDQVRLFAELGVDIILLDNMTLDEMRAAVGLVAGRCRCEASGNMTLERVRAVAETGVDFISVGALTHSVRAIDFSLEVLR